MFNIFNTNYLFEMMMICTEFMLMVIVCFVAIRTSSYRDLVVIQVKRAISLSIIIAFIILLFKSVFF